MTKQQKARAHLARAQELLSQGTLAFGVKQELEVPGSPADNTQPNPVEEEMVPAQVTRLLSLPDEMINQIITKVDGKHLRILLEANNRNLTDIIVRMLLVKSKGKHTDNYKIEDDFYIHREPALGHALNQNDFDMIYLLVKHGEQRPHPYIVKQAITHHSEMAVTALLKGGEEKYIEKILPTRIMQTPWMLDHTALSLAVMLGRYNIAKLLIRHKADVNTTAFSGIRSTRSTSLTPLDFAINRARTEPLFPVSDNFYSNTLSSTDKVDFVKFLLFSGAERRMVRPDIKSNLGMDDHRLTALLEKSTDYYIRTTGAHI